MYQKLYYLMPTSVLRKSFSNMLNDYDKLKASILYSKPELIEMLSNRFAVEMFHKCRISVPAYSVFLKKKGFNESVKTINDFNKIPETSKKSYIFTAESLASLCINGDIKNVNFWVKSSGHSGRQQEWGKSNEELYLSSQMLTAGLDLIFNLQTKKTLVINAYIISSWITGISMAVIAHQKNSILNIGPDEDELIDAINLFSREYEQILIFGYPPFIKHFVDYCTQKNIRLDRCPIHFFVGGEWFPEEWRTYVKSRLHSDSKVLAAYGSSDLGVIGGTETDATIKIKKFALENESLFRDLFGKTERVPMLFQYPPFLFIRSNERRELVFTSLLEQTAMPLVNYNLEDTGGVIQYNDMIKILKKYNLNINIDFKLPFIFIEGRATGAVKLCAFMIYPENIKECIYSIPELAKITTGRFKMRTVYNKMENESLYIDFELIRHIKKTKKLANIISRKIVAKLRRINEGYNAVYKNIPQSSKINVVLHEFGKFPYLFKVKYKYT
ncbi:MAG: hypothetical protein QXK37_00240 [Candidatus Woesearchaeota archaeon]